MNLRVTYKLFEIFVLGVISGMPLSIILIAIMTWLKESNVPLELITTFVAAKLFYSLKFLKAPFIECFDLPYLSRCGKRKGWMILCTGANAIILCLMAMCNPTENLLLLYLLTLMIGCFASIYDINKSAYIIEQFDLKIQAMAYANVSLGFRIGMTIISVGSFYFVDSGGNWNSAFFLMSLIFAFASLFITTLKEEEIVVVINDSDSFIDNYIIAPFLDFLTKPNALLILLAIIFSKMGEAMQGIISNLFYLDLGYSKTQVATVTSIYGFFVVICGTYLAPYLINKFGNLKSLIIIGLVQAITNFSFVWLTYQPINIFNLGIIITAENFAVGLGSTVILSYLGMLCNRKYSATQFALLSSTASLCNTVITMFSGSLVELLNWNLYFMFTTSLVLISILICAYLFYVRKTA
jgi:PAT family beta-lactamase induction signal transducer AmpG